MTNMLFSSTIPDPKKAWVDGEDDDERILYIFRRSLITNVDWLFITGILLVVPFVANFILAFSNSPVKEAVSPMFLFAINVFWYVFTLGFVLQNFLNWYFNIYIITDKKIMDMDFVGFLHKNISEAPITSVEDVTSTVSGALKVIFNYGDVSIQTAAEKREFEFSSVANPAKVRDIISDIVTAAKNGKSHKHKERNQ